MQLHVDFVLLYNLSNLFRQEELEVKVDDEEEKQRLAPEFKQNLTTPPNGKISMSVEDLYCHTERAVYEVKQYQSCQELHRSQGATGVRQRSVSENGVKASAKEMFMEVEVTEKRSILDKIKNTILFKIFR